MTDKIKLLMFINKLSQLDMCKELNVCRTTFNHKVNGKKEFTISEALKMSKIFNTTLDEIFN